MMRAKWAIVIVAVCLVATVAAIAYAAGKTSAPEVLQAQRFELVDEDGRVVAGLATDGDGAAQLRFWDGDGHVRLAVGLRAKGEPVVRLQDETGKLHVAELSVWGPEGKVMAELRLTQGGRHGVDLCSDNYGARLTMWDGESTCSSSLSVGTEGRAVLHLSNPTTGARAQLDLDEQGRAALALDSQQLKPAVSLEAAGDGRCGLALFGKGGSGRAVLSTWPDGRSRLHLNDEQGEARADVRVGSDGRPSLALR